MKPKRWLLIGILVASTAMAGAVSLQTGEAEAQTFPILPFLYSGSATAGGASAPDSLVDAGGACISLCITARIRDYATAPVPVRDGRYNALTVSPPDESLFQQTITFYLDGVQAQETDTFIRAGSPVIDLNFSLTFDRLPEPTPTPTPIPPTPTPIPQVAQPAAYSGPIVVAGGTVPEGAVLVARIGSYESEPALIEDEEYRSLVLNPQDFSLVGQTVEFLLNRVKSGTTDIYESGSFKTNFGLVFVGVPEPTATPTPTPTPLPPKPTQTPVPPPTPTRTPILQHPSPVAATATGTPRPTPAATPTAVPPTPAPPTPPPTVVVAAAVATPTPTSSGGGCFSNFGSAPAMAGLGNLMLLLAPLAFIAGRRRLRR